MLKIEKSVVDSVWAHCEREFPLEACGYLAEKDGVVRRHYELINTKKSETRYFMDPAEQFRAVRHMRSEGYNLCAVYHSHPSTKAIPSEVDKRLAYDTSLSYMIFSLLDHRLKSFRIRDGVTEEEKIEVIGDN